MSETTSPPGRRERKKAATRRAIADAALNLFLEHGYDQVSIRDICEAADVSTTTLFKHFTGKEALVFDEEGDQEAALVAAVLERPAGRSVVAALRAHMLSRLDTAADPAFASYERLVDGTPALREYSHRMWMRHETALAHAIAHASGAAADDPACSALAHFALETLALAHGRDDPRLAIETAFDLLEHGWHRST
ncbi:TetR family transcriptional regulator [Sphaerisporangium krabiense]|uniref:AcrR family transcriptional regulator n=1 Tax=Sphaerisporangium krabiense TaxID=763782 RepID=A0A7W9DTJ3_9ACTN|nr:TetR/AcrR family transcriptional regulator [Sphaerisporangium krabiense]MBB5630234.1 AcrR family transcriptional regulator [Sphaerisporangium krabiense]GII62815.1 TetR family transcriptional regulator [Sphaerisporangium krabiense]